MRTFADSGLKAIDDRRLIANCGADSSSSDACSMALFPFYPQFGLSRRSSMAVSPESARVLSPQSEKGGEASDPYCFRNGRGLSDQSTVEQIYRAIRLVRITRVMRHHANRRSSLMELAQETHH